MATIETEHIKNWEDLSLLINDYFTHFNNYVFRGQGCESWLLEPTLSRALKQAGYKKTKKKVAIEQHLSKFKENIRGRINLNFDSASDDEFWALGQHFGLATPLLDWTRSPYVALFFALIGSEKNENSVLYAVLEEDIESINSEKHGKQKNVHTVNPLTHYNDRLVNQRGIFLHIPVQVNFEKWVESGKECGWITMYKITFPSSIKEQTLAALNNMNINYLSLFPDIHGSCYHSNFETSIEPYLDRNRKKLYEE
ncbi:MAG: FRG domain-containing protein [Methylomarinum sp.]|nr:FRG domain-containing protein [Methylomarinum sp.]